MDYEEACFMHLTPGVLSPYICNGRGCILGFLFLVQDNIIDSYMRRQGVTLRMPVSCINKKQQKNIIRQ